MSLKSSWQITHEMLPASRQARMLAIVLLTYLLTETHMASASHHLRRAGGVTSSFTTCKDDCGDEFSTCSTSAGGFGETVTCLIQHKGCSERCYEQRMLNIRKKLVACRRKKGVKHLKGAAKHIFQWFDSNDARSGHYWLIKVEYQRKSERMTNFHDIF